MPVKKRVTDRAKEPSTYAGLGALAASIAMSIPKAAPYATAIGGLASLVAMFLPERSK